MPVGPESHRLDEVAMTVERRDAPAGRDLPDPHTPVLTRRDEVPAIRAEREVQNVTLVREDRQRFGACSRVPELDGIVPASGGQPLAVGAVGEAVDPFLVARE